MSKEAVEKIIGKAAVDPKFRNDLFSKAEKALEGY